MTRSAIPAFAASRRQFLTSWARPSRRLGFPDPRVGLEWNGCRSFGALVLGAANEITSQIGGRTPDGFPEPQVALVEEGSFVIGSERPPIAPESSTGVA